MTIRNGLTLGYTVAFINAALVLLTSFGVSLSQGQQAAVIGFVNAAVLLAARVLHMPERTPTGVQQVEHVPVLVTKPSAHPTDPATAPAAVIEPLVPAPLASPEAAPAPPGAPA